MPSPWLLLGLRGAIVALGRWRERRRQKRAIKAQIDAMRRKEDSDVGDKILGILVPFVPPKYRTIAGVTLFTVGSVLTALSSPDLIGILPPKLAPWGALASTWGAAATALGIRFQKA